MCNESHMITWWKNFLFLWKIYFMFMLSQRMVCVSAGNWERNIFSFCLQTDIFHMAFQPFTFCVCLCVWLFIYVLLMLLYVRHSPCVLIYIHVIDWTIYLHHKSGFCLIDDLVNRAVCRVCGVFGTRDVFKCDSIVSSKIFLHITGVSFRMTFRRTFTRWTIDWRLANWSLIESVLFLNRIQSYLTSRT